MTAKSKETAEQKLLKMIEVTDPDAAQTSKVQAKAEKGKNVIGLVRLVNKLLIVAIITAGVWLGFEVKEGRTFLASVDSFDDQGIIVNKSRGMDVSIPSANRLSYYLSKVKKRNIFQPYEKIEIKNITEVSEENRKIARETANLRLVGVSWLDSVDSASVMIEDIDKQTTFFLRRGEKVGDVTVKTIYADSVELGYENEEIIIKYEQSQL